MAKRSSALVDALTIHLNQGAPMPVPGYQEFMPPLPRITGDANEHAVTEAMPTFAEQMNIPDRHFRNTNSSVNLSRADEEE
jgi:hypothetical protein